MGREVRRVPADWEHPKHSYLEGQHQPLFDHFDNDLESFKVDVNKMGWKEALAYYGGGPNPEDYMPDWPEAERTHYQMYETTSEGTPVSPPMETPELLARWLVDNDASSFGPFRATYEEWLNVCGGAWAASMVIENGVMKSGVEAISK